MSALTPRFKVFVLTDNSMSIGVYDIQVCVYLCKFLCVYVCVCGCEWVCIEVCANV